MEKKLYEKNEVVIEISGKDVLLKLDTKGVDINVAVDAEYFFTKLAEAIPGQVDDTVIQILIGALKA